MHNNKRRQLIKIAKYYYQDGLTQEEIAKKLSLSRQKVGRLMNKLIPEGIVKISIDESLDNYIELENMLEKKFNLKEVVIVSAQEKNPKTLDAIGKAAAIYLDQIVKPNNVIGVAWGRTLSYVSKHIIKDRKNYNLTIVQLAGGVYLYDYFLEGEIKNELSKQSGEITRLISNKLGAKPYLMHNPLFVDNAESKKILMKESSVERVFKKIEECDIAMVSIASLGNSATPFKEGFLTNENLKFLHENRAVGNFLFRYFDINGKEIEAPFYNRLMCPDLEIMRKIPTKICVAGTREKINAIYGGIKANLVDVLITDDEVAKELLKK